MPNVREAQERILKGLLEKNRSLERHFDFIEGDDLETGVALFREWAEEDIIKQRGRVSLAPREVVRESIANEEIDVVSIQLIDEHLYCVKEEFDSYRTELYSKELSGLLVLLFDHLAFLERLIETFWSRIDIQKPDVWDCRSLDKQLSHLELLFRSVREEAASEKFADFRFSMLALLNFVCPETSSVGLQDSLPEGNITELLSKDIVGNIISALGTAKMKRGDLLKKSGYAAGGHFNTYLYTLPKEGLLRHEKGMYWVNPDYYELLNICPDTSGQT